MEAQKAHSQLTDEDLYLIQKNIEKMTMSFDEQSMFKTTPDIIKMLISSDKECAKDFLRSRLSSEDDKEII